jgi:hypothetical protein
VGSEDVAHWDAPIARVAAAILAISDGGDFIGRGGGEAWRALDERGQGRHGRDGHSHWHRVLDIVHHQGAVWLAILICKEYSMNENERPIKQAIHMLSLLIP